MDENGHNPTVYLDRAEMKAAESGIPFDEKPDDGCWNCAFYDGSRYRCTKDRNNLDPDYYIPGRDDTEPDDCCEEWEEDPDAAWDDYFRGNEP